MVSPRPSPDDLRRRALTYARAQLSAGGPETVKARGIAEAAGVSVGTIYNLFGDLDQVLFAVNAEVYDELLAAVSGDLPSVETASDVGAALLRLSENYLNFVATNAELWAGVLAFNRRQKTHVPDWYRDKERQLFSVLEAAMAPLRPTDDRSPLALAPQALWAAVHGIISVSVGRDGLLATHDEIAAQIHLVVRSVIAELERDAR